MTSPAAFPALLVAPRDAPSVVQGVASVLCIEAGSAAWPECFAGVEGLPARLWCRGAADLLGSVPRVAIVGTRSPTPYGEAQAQRFGRALARQGVCVVSGMARGIDQAAHRAALEARGATIAVLGNGVDRPWPDGPIGDEIARGGLLVSEFEPGTAPRPHHFPLRNRVISALSAGVIVVEAAHASGSLITARWAAEQGREVWALPGRVDHPMARGSHRLIREGATLVESPEEVLDQLGLGAPSADATSDDTSAGDVRDPLGARILAALRGETLVCDEIAAVTGVAPSEVLARLVMLELAGRVVRSPGALWRLAAR